MSQTAVLVWLSATFLLPTFRADLAALASRRSLPLLVPPGNAARFHASAYAPDAVAQLETLLEEARNAAASLEAGRALALLERADNTLREHPELPQSAWLMAEILQRSAELRRAGADGAEAARALRIRAQALEGPRAEPFADPSPPDEASEPATHPVRILGLELGDELEWNGRESATELALASGEHHARVLRNGELLWAGWLQVEDTDAQLTLPVPASVACSPDDVARATFVAGRAVPWPAARCERYLLARAGAGGALEAAWCERNACSAPVRWPAHRATPTPVDRAPVVWPYALAASAGALLLTGAVLWQTGAFDRQPANARERWVYEGPQALTLPF